MDCYIQQTKESSITRKTIDTEINCKEDQAVFTLKMQEKLWFQKTGSSEGDQVSKYAGRKDYRVKNCIYRIRNTLHCRLKEVKSHIAEPFPGKGIFHDRDDVYYKNVFISLIFHLIFDRL